MMTPEHRAWIADHVPTHEAAYGKCESVAKAMAAAFKDLKIVKGHYYCAIWGRRAHWWLVDSAGEIVDPTLRQFPSAAFAGPEWYEELDESAPRPTGICMNCGAECFDGEHYCSDRCRSALIAYYGVQP